MYTDDDDISIKPKTGRQLFSNWKKTTEASHIIRDMINHQLGLCPCCKTSLGGIYHIDHIFPISKLTPDTMYLATHHSNLVALCPSCNLKKSDRVYLIKEAGDIPDLDTSPLDELPKKRKRKPQVST
jgi:5-methylcytosine-specific restriction endonuclease McrA